jgi:hypothetical protein
LSRNYEATHEAVGGLPGLETWARANRTEFYTKLLIKLLPTQAQIDGSLIVHGGMPSEAESRRRMREVLGLVAPHVLQDDEPDDGEHFESGNGDGMNGR